MLSSPVMVLPAFHGENQLLWAIAFFFLSVVLPESREMAN